MATVTVLGRRALVALAATAALGALGALSACDRTAAPAQFKAVDITGADYAHDLNLPDADGRVRHMADFKGKLTVVFFGFTQCPDVCPTTLLEIAQVRKSMGANGDKVQVVFVTVDPDRDTPQVLKAYVNNFGADVVALRGNDAQTKALAKDFKVFYAKVPGASPGTYTMDHTAASYIFDTQGKVRLFTRYGTGAEALKHDLELLLAQG